MSAAMRRCLTALTLAAAAVCLSAGLTAPARADVSWLCRPGMSDDPCELGLDTTVRESGRPERVETPARPAAADRPVDCFYVYPTVSNQLAANATKSRDPELVSIARYQASRFSGSCRMYAPIYRQITLVALPIAITLGAGLPDEDQQLAYSDVLEAWRSYLANDNHGRGVVLIGHSQGSLVLRRLIKEEIDPNPDVRRRVVGGVLLGGNVTTRTGSATGGDWRNVPVCTRPAEPGCVVAYSTYAADPPSNSLFGRTDGSVGGGPSGPGYEVACTDPGVLSGIRTPVGVTVPSAPFAAGTIAAGILVTEGGAPPTARTSWVEPADRFQGACRTIGGAHVYRYDPVGPGSRRPNPFLDATWGTHLLDVQLGLERLTSIVADQTQHWLKPQLRLKRTCAGRGRGRTVRATLDGADADAVASVAFRVGSRTVGRDAAPPFTASLPRRSGTAGRGGRLTAVATLARGQATSLTLRRTLPACGARR